VPNSRHNTTAGFSVTMSRSNATEFSKHQRDQMTRIIQGHESFTTPAIQVFIDHQNRREGFWGVDNDTTAYPKRARFEIRSKCSNQDQYYVLSMATFLLLDFQLPARRTAAFCQWERDFSNWIAALPEILRCAHWFHAAILGHRHHCPRALTSVAMHSTFWENTSKVKALVQVAPTAASYIRNPELPFAQIVRVVVDTIKGNNKAWKQQSKLWEMLPSPYPFSAWLTQELFEEINTHATALWSSIAFKHALGSHKNTWLTPATAFPALQKCPEMYEFLPSALKQLPEVAMTAIRAKSVWSVNKHDFLLTETLPLHMNAPSDKDSQARIYRDLGIAMLCRVKDPKIYELVYDDEDDDDDDDDSRQITYPTDVAQYLMSNALPVWTVHTHDALYPLARVASIPTDGSIVLSCKTVWPNSDIICVHDHPFYNGDPIRFLAATVIQHDQTVPDQPITTLVPNNTYYVVCATSNCFKLADAPEGTPIKIKMSAAGCGLVDEYDTGPFFSNYGTLKPLHSGDRLALFTALADSHREVELATRVAHMLLGPTKRLATNVFAATKNIDTTLQIAEVVRGRDTPIMPWTIKYHTCYSVAIRQRVRTTMCVAHALRKPNSQKLPFVPLELWVVILTAAIDVCD
jgi:hypothetical protein